MKEAFLVIAVICTIQITGFCQDDQAEISTSSAKQSPETFHDFSYYFTGMLNNFFVFSMDTLKLSKKEIDREFPRFEFYNDSTFSFFYNLGERERAVRNLSTGELEKRVVSNPQKINGDWQSDNIQENIRLTLPDKSNVNYLINESDKYIYFIKQVN